MFCGIGRVNSASQWEEGPRKRLQGLAYGTCEAYVITGEKASWKKLEVGQRKAGDLVICQKPSLARWQTTLPNSFLKKKSKQVN